MCCMGSVRGGDALELNSGVSQVAEDRMGVVEAGDED